MKVCNGQFCHSWAELPWLSAGLEAIHKDQQRHAELQLRFGAFLLTHHAYSHEWVRLGDIKVTFCDLKFTSLNTGVHKYMCLGLACLWTYQKFQFHSKDLPNARVKRLKFKWVMLRRARFLSRNMTGAPPWKGK